MGSIQVWKLRANVSINIALDLGFRNCLKQLENRKKMNEILRLNLYTDWSVGGLCFELRCEIFWFEINDGLKFGLFGISTFESTMNRCILLKKKCKKLMKYK